jgi:anaerobic glycerol-3-phosphate dehydrogenase
MGKEIWSKLLEKIRKLRAKEKVKASGDVFGNGILSLAQKKM